MSVGPEPSAVSAKREDLAAFVEAVSASLRRIGHALVEPLRKDPDVEMVLSVPEAQTTTIDGDIGWADRPPAFLECPECGAEIYQHRPDGALNCADCFFECPAEEFGDLELLYLQCSVCGNEMDHGRRHPEQFSVPEYASCDNCRYHWEFEHF